LTGGDPIRKLLSMDALTRRSPAKLNLTLRITGLRPDGFHELESLVALVDLCDTLTVAPHEDGTYSLTCDDPTLPSDGSNLVLRAARALARSTGLNRGAEFTLQKRIPAGAGLGGGSSNAALTLVMLNEVWQTGRSRAELAQVGGELGSDVPLFLHGPLCVIRGRGEHVEELPACLDAWAVLILPALQCATPAIYRAWDARPSRTVHPPLAEILSSLNAPDALMPLLFNDLEQPAFDVAPELAVLARAVEAAGGRRVCLTGSGSGLFHLFNTRADAEEFARRVRESVPVRLEIAPLRAV
jgi:4-diphosphocytidyl-2-C-methyl-D-erythritol kinase